MGEAVRRSSGDLWPLGCEESGLIQPAESMRVSRHCFGIEARFFGILIRFLSGGSGSRSVRESLRDRLEGRFFGVASTASSRAVKRTASPKAVPLSRT
jgi:hypothetical protein